MGMSLTGLVPGRNLFMHEISRQPSNRQRRDGHAFASQEYKCELQALSFLFMKHANLVVLGRQHMRKVSMLGICELSAHSDVEDNVCMYVYTTNVSLM
jgi:hypothetical protein